MVQPCVILNPQAGTAARSGEDLASRLRAAGYDVRLTSAGGEATQIARERALAGAPLVVAAGGDGTISEVANGLLDAHTGARLGLLPLGTGNDLARTLDIPLGDVDAALALLRQGRERVIDVIAVEPDDAPRTYAVNVAAGGFSGQVDEVLTPELKARWGPLAYVFSAARVLPDLTGYRTTLAFDDGQAEQVEALNVIVANARSCGGGVAIAPGADVEDGLLDVVVVRFSKLLDLARVALRLARGDDLDDADVYRRRARAVRITASPPMWFNVDGELVSKAAVTFRVVPRALRVVVA